MSILTESNHMLRNKLRESEERSREAVSRWACPIERAGWTPVVADGFVLSFVRLFVCLFVFSMPFTYIFAPLDPSTSYSGGP